MTPAIAVTIKCVLIGIGVLLSGLATASIDNTLTMNEVIGAVAFGWGAGLGYAGLGAATSLEAIGKK